MSDWARRMQLRATEAMSSCGNIHPHRQRIEKVKFGVPLESYCGEDIPSPLLVLLLRVNKEGPTRKDMFRAPGQEASTKKLQYYLQTGRLVDYNSYPLNTIASVIKKFLRKIPGGIFTPAGEEELFKSAERSLDIQIKTARNVILSLPVCVQKLLCNLLGTFRAMDLNAVSAQTGMTADAIGVSVAPSFFLSCVLDRQTATVADVDRFRVFREVETASAIMRFLIGNFTDGNLFPLSIYEEYAAVTGRILRVEGQLISNLLPAESRREFAAERSASLPSLSQPIVTQPGPSGGPIKLEVIPEGSDDSMRLSTSLVEVVDDVFETKIMQEARAFSMPATPTHKETRPLTAGAETAKSLCNLPQVHEWQEARMRARSDWFLRPAGPSGIARTRCSGLTDLTDESFSNLSLYDYV